MHNAIAVLAEKHQRIDDHEGLVVFSVNGGD